LVRSEAAAATISGAAITNDIPHLQANRDNPAVSRPSVTHRSYAQFTKIVCPIHTRSNSGTNIAARAHRSARQSLFTGIACGPNAPAARGRHHDGCVSVFSGPADW